MALRYIIKMRHFKINFTAKDESKREKKNTEQVESIVFDE